MGARATHAGRRPAALAAGLALALGAACATVEPPPGGPEDRTPPRLAAVVPESGATGQAGLRELRLAFSEKVDPRQAERFVRLYPPAAFAGTAWDGRREAVVRLAEPLPPDTVIVVEVMRGLPDAHRVPADRARFFAFATGDSLPAGEVSGSLVKDGKALRQAVVELLDAAPEADTGPRRPVLRRAETDSLGRYRFPWLPVPGGPWALRAFEDGDGDGRAGEREAQRLLPDTVRTTRARPRAGLAATPLFAPTTPGTVAGVIDSTPPWKQPLLGWVERIAEEDTGWAARPLSRAPPGLRPVARGERVAWDKAGPGLVRLVLFVDVDGDSLPSLVAQPPDTVRAWLEPHALVDSLAVEPGLETALRAPVFSDTLARWTGPPPAAADGAVGSAAPDTAAAR